MRNKSGRLDKWYNADLLNGWNQYSTTEFAPPSYMASKEGVVYLRGIASAPGAPDHATAPIMRLPPGYRPDYTLVLHAWSALLSSSNTSIVVVGGNTVSGSNTSGVAYKAGDIVFTGAGIIGASPTLIWNVSYPIGKEKLKLL